MKTMIMMICRKNEESSYESDNDECNHDDYDYNSDSDDEHSECPSDYDKWAKWNEERWKHKKKVKSHSDQNNDNMNLHEISSVCFMLSLDIELGCK